MDEDCVFGYCCDVLVSIIKLEVKIDKFLDLFMEIVLVKDCLIVVEEENKQLRKVVEYMGKELIDLKICVVNMCF